MELYSNFDSESLINEFRKDIIKGSTVDELKKELARREQDALDNELEALQDWAEDSLLPAMNNTGVKKVSMHVFDGRVMILKEGCIW